MLEPTIHCPILSDTAFHMTEELPEYGGPEAGVIIPAVTRSIESMERMGQVVIDPDEYLDACGSWEPITDRYDGLQSMRLTLVSEALARIVHGKDMDGLAQFGACLPGEGDAQSRVLRAVEDALHGDKERKGYIDTSGLSYQACYKEYERGTDSDKGAKALNGVHACLFLSHEYVLHTMNQADQEKLKTFLSEYLLGPDFAEIEEAKNRFLLEAARGLEQQLNLYAKNAETGEGSEERKGFEGAGAPYRDLEARTTAIRQKAERALKRSPDEVPAIAADDPGRT